MGNCPRMIATNTRMKGRQFVNSLSIRGWSLGVKVNALLEVQSASREELSPTLRFRDATRSALMPSVPVLSEVEGLDKAFRGEL